MRLGTLIWLGAPLAAITLIVSCGTADRTPVPTPITDCFPGDILGDDGYCHQSNGFGFEFSETNAYGRALRICYSGRGGFATFIEGGIFGKLTFHPHGSYYTVECADGSFHTLDDCGPLWGVLPRPTAQRC